jgi:hypothetical protein
LSAITVRSAPAFADADRHDRNVVGIADFLELLPVYPAEVAERLGAAVRGGSTARIVFATAVWAGGTRLALGKGRCGGDGNGKGGQGGDGQNGLLQHLGLLLMSGGGSNKWLGVDGPPFAWAALNGR